MNPTEKKIYINNILKKLDNDTKILYQKYLQNKLTELEAKNLKQKIPELFVNTTLAGYFSFNGLKSIPYDLCPNIEHDCLAEREGVNVNYGKLGKKLVGDVIEKRIHKGNLFTYAPKIRLHNGNASKDDLEILSNLVKKELIETNVNSLKTLIEKLEEIDLEKKIKISANTLSLINKYLPEYNDKLKLVKINKKVIENAWQEANDILENFESSAEEVKQKLSHVGAEKLQVLRKEHIGFGRAPDNEIEFEVGKNGLNFSGIVSQITKELTRGDDFDLQSYHCSSTAYNILKAGAKNNPNKLYFDYLLSNSGKVWSVITNPSSVYNMAKVLKNNLSKNKSPSVFDWIREFRLESIVIAKLGLSYAIKENTPYLEVEKLFGIKMPKIPEDKKFYLYGYLIETKNKQELLDWEFEEGDAEKIWNFKQKADKAFKGFRLRKRVLLGIVVAPRVILTRVFNPLKFYNELAKGREYIKSIKNKTKLARGLKVFANTVMLPAQVVVAPFAAVQYGARSLFSGVKYFFKKTFSIFKKNKTKLLIPDIHKSRDEKLKSVIKENTVTVKGKNYEQILKDFYLDLNNEHNRFIVNLSDKAQSSILKAIDQKKVIKDKEFLNKLVKSGFIKEGIKPTVQNIYQALASKSISRLNKISKLEKQNKKGSLLFSSKIKAKKLIQNYKNKMKKNKNFSKK